MEIEESMKRRYWTDSEQRKLRSVYADMDNESIGNILNRSWSAIQNMANKLRLSKSDEFMSGPKCRLQKGSKPWNLGVTGYMGANRTSFKKGHKPQTWRPVGSERTNPDGTLERKVSDTGSKQDWKPVKDLVYVEHFGQIPKGKFVVHKDRNRANFAPANLALVSRAENMRLNTVHRYPKEVQRLVQLRGALNRQINKRLHEKQAIRS
jgi:hypothetical protein